jgi:hypothetical protein
VRGEAGGAIAKLLGALLLVAVLASAGLYLYAKQQRPLEIGTVHIAVTGGSTDPATVEATAGDQIWIATIVRNTGRLPVRIDGLGVPTSGPWIATASGLGDGADPATVAPFAPFAIDPGEGVGIVVAVSLDPGVPCGKLRQPESLPALAIDYTSYGVTSTQTVPVEDAPTVTGLPDACRSTS